MTPEAKLFVGALSGATTPETMEKYFSTFGEVIDCKVMMDNVTGRSRGFGFVTFKNAADMTNALKASHPHVLDNKQIDPKHYTSKDVQMQKKEAERVHTATYKIFVGGLTQNMEESEVKCYFETLGPITAVSFAMSKEDGKNKGFGFVTFVNASSVDEAVKIQFHTIGGKRVEAKRAFPRESAKPPPTASQTPQRNDYQNDNRRRNEEMWTPRAAMNNMAVNQTVSQGGLHQYSEYGGYGTYASYPNFNCGGYSGPMGSNYPQLGSYGQQNTSSYYPTFGNQNPSGDSKSYHPYKRV